MFTHYYTATIKHPDNTDVIKLRVNGIGKNDKAARIDAQRQVRAHIQHLTYTLEQRAE